MDPGYISQLQLPVVVKTEHLAVVKDEPPESEIMENGIDDIPYLSHEDIIPNIKDLDTVSHTLCEDSIKSETVPENIFETVFVKTENAHFVKIENVIKSENLNKAEYTSDGQEVVEVQSNRETDKQHNSEKTNFAECYRTRETALWEEVKEKIKVIRAPVIPVKPHEYMTLAKGKHICNHCLQVYGKLSGVKFHIKKMHREVTTMYQCPYCSFQLKWRSNLKSHIDKHKDTNTKDTRLFQYYCDKCYYKTHRLQQLNRHKLTHLKPEEIHYFYCYHCSYKSSRKCHLKSHISTHFKNVEIKHEKRYRCDQCDYKTYKRSHLNRHKLNHLNPEEVQYFYCYHCSYKFNQKDNLRKHIFRHFKRSEIKFYCYICDFMTLRRDLIIDHIKKHSKVKIKSEINEGS